MISTNDLRKEKMSIKIDLKIFLFAIIYLITKQIKIYLFLLPTILREKIASFPTKSTPYL